MIDRRRFIRAAGATIAMAALATEAQQAARLPRIGVLSSGGAGTGAANLSTEVLRQGLQELGYVEGRTAVIEWRWWEGKPERLRDAVAEMVRLNPDVIVVGGSEATKAMKEATRSIPIVFIGPSYPVEEGLVESFARPGGNITGITVAQSDHVPKMLQLLRDVVPALADVGVIWSPANPGSTFVFRDTEAAARGLKLKVLPVPMASDADVEPALAAIARARPGALILNPAVIADRQRRANRRAGDPVADTVDHAVKSVDGTRPAHVLRRRFSGYPTTHPQLRGSHSQGREACRHAGRAADQVRAGHQHEDRESHRRHDPVIAAAARGHGDSMML